MKKLALMLVITLTMSMMLVSAEPQFWCDDTGVFEAETLSTVQNGEYISKPYKIGVPETHESNKWTASYGVQNLPSSYDMRSRGLITPVKNQSPHGTCWTFAATSSLESYLLKRRLVNYTPDFSENSMRFSMSSAASDGDWIWGLYRDPEDGGNFSRSTAYYARGSGPVNETDDPYDASTDTRHTIEWLKRNSNVIDNPPVYQGNNNYLNSTADTLLVTETVELGEKSTLEENLERVKTLIYCISTVDIAMYWNISNFNSTTSSYYSNDGSGPNHEVSLIGWDDNYPAENFSQQPSGNGAFLVKNSWGPHFGQSGYMWLSYYDTYSTHDASCISGVTLEKYDNVYQYDPLGVTGTLPVNKNTITYCALFNGKYGETVKRVGFYTVEEGCTYKIYINPSGDSPVTGTTLVAQGYSQYAGFHAVELNSDIMLTGTKFCVRVEVSSTSLSTLKIPLEMPISGYSPMASQNARETFFYFNNRWYDAATAFSSGGTSVCLKAYTNDPKEDDKFTYGICYQDGSGNRVDNVNAGRFSTIFNLSNLTGQPESVNCITAIYHDDALYELNISSVNNFTEDTSVDVPFEIPSGGGYTVKSMIFDGNDFISPVTVAPARLVQYTPVSPTVVSDKLFIKPNETVDVTVLDTVDGKLTDVTGYFDFTTDDTSVFIENSKISAGIGEGYAQVKYSCSGMTEEKTFEVYIIY